MSNDYSFTQFINAHEAFSLALQMLAGTAPFSACKMSDMGSTLKGEINRHHYLFAIDGQTKKIEGYMGWGLFPKKIAEKIMNEKYVPSEDECGEGDYGVVFTFVAYTPEVCKALARFCRAIHPNKTCCFRRVYNDQSKPSHKAIRSTGNLTWE